MGALPTVRVYEPVGSFVYVCKNPLPGSAPLGPVSVHPGALTKLPVSTSVEFTVMVPTGAGVTVTTQVAVFLSVSVSVMVEVPAGRRVEKNAPPPDGGKPPVTDQE